MIDRLVTALGGAPSALTAEECAEAIWLARFLPRQPGPPRAGPAATASDAPPGAPPEPPASPPSTSPARQPTRPEAPAVTEAEPSAKLYLPPPANGPRDPSSLPLRTPGVPALPHAREIARALAPLRRSVPARHAVRLDEAETARRSAEARMLQPCLTPVTEPWLDLVLLVDGSPSMVVWEATATEIRTLADRMRVHTFRRIQVWYLRPDAKGHRPILTSDGGSTARDPRELVDPEGRQLTMVLSDCTGAIWDAPELRRWLAIWGRSGPVAVVQPLPQRLWHRCRPTLHPVLVRPTRPAAPAAQLHPRLRDEVPDHLPRGAVAIPVLELAPRWFAAGAALVSGRTLGPVAAVALLTTDPRPLLVDPLREPPSPEPLDLTPAQRVARFRAMASDEARQLAEFLAAAPLTLPVMRLVQRLMLPRSQPQDLAEVYLSGLLRHAASWAEDTPVEQARYEFLPGVRQELLSGLRVGEALRILDVVSRYVNEHMGAALDFPALLAGQVSDRLATRLGRPFAEVAYTVLRSLGGRYSELARRLAPAALGPPATPTQRTDRRLPIAATPEEGDDMTAQTAPGDRGRSSVGEQPAVFGNVPPRNPDFTGREELLNVLRQRLTDNVTAVLPHTVHGLGGVGKSQLAVEYVYKYASDYDLIWWVPAEQPTRIRESLVALARKLDLVSDDVDVSQALETVYDALRTGRPYGRWLLVFDNATRAEDLMPFLSNPGGHVLITSRNHNWAGVADSIEVDVFTREESIELIRRRLPELDDEDTDRLAEQLGDLPLALEQAAAWMLATGTPIDEYLGQLEKRVGLLLRESSPASYSTPVVITWGLAFDQLAEQTPAALQLLELCAFLGSEPISIRLLPMGRYAGLPSLLDATVRDDIQLRRAVRDIGKYGLAKVDATRNSIQIHRLVQATLRDRLTPADRETYRTAVQKLLAAANPGDPTEDQEIWPRHAELNPHVLASGAIDGESDDIRKVVLDQIRYLYVSGDYESSRELGSIAYRRWLEKLGAANEQTIITARFLANALRSTGNPQEARRLNERTYEIARDTLGPDHEHTLALANSFGADLRLFGEWQRARELDEGLLEAHRRVFGEDAPDTLRCANNLAVDYRLLGDFERARRTDEDNWARYRRVLGDTNPYTLFTATLLSRDLDGLGRYHEALRLQRQWLPLHRGSLRPDHSNVLRATRLHAVTLRKTGLYSEALTVAREVYSLCLRRFRENHADTISAAMTLFNILPRTEQERVARARALAEARVLGEETLTGYQRVLGDEHPFTYVCMTNLAIVFRLLGDYTEGRRLDERAVAGLRAGLGMEHPYTLCATVNLANDLAASRDHAGAASLLRETLAAARQVNGQNHPETLICAANLSIELSALGDRPAARELRDAAIAGYERTVGLDHPDAAELLASHRVSIPIDPPPT
ncbi:FxSxx-COOH system tetratricopeptide repeat protein [Micromonospora parva]|uniref:FxSxx-COOH system tetratricopeptide repeat protein n=1 Tax=Micromonospora parva TaxID=1464048 RepID=UPI0033E981F7